MDISTATQISELLNLRNNLVKKYSSNDIIANCDNYRYLLEGDTIVCMCELKKVQWYQFEICHLSVNPKYEGKGFASKLMEVVINDAKKQNGRILQATIREDNRNSSRLFERKGFKKTSEFFYPLTGNNVFVYQKTISVK